MDKQNQTSVTEFIFLALTSSLRFPVLLFTLFLLIYLVILLINGLLMLVIKVDTNLHTPMYFFIFNLSCSDICYTSSVVPKTFFNFLSTKPSIAFQQCVVQMFFAVVFGGVQLFVVTAMAYDRQVAITNPLRYKIVMSWVFCRKLLLIIWISSSMIAFAMVSSVFLLPFCPPFEIDHFFCDVGQVLLLTCPSIEIHEIAEFVTFTLGLIMFTIPFLVIIISYTCILASILNIRTKEGQYKAFSTCSSHLSIVVTEFACLGFMYLRPKTAFSIDKDRIIVVLFLLGAPILNPMIYSVRNKAVKKGILKLSHGRLTFSKIKIFLPSLKK